MKIFRLYKIEKVENTGNHKFSVTFKPTMIGWVVSLFKHYIMRSKELADYPGRKVIINIDKGRKK